MKFFTPQLYLEFQSPIFTIATMADAKWEVATCRYRAHLNNLPLTPAVAILNDLCFHNAQFVSLRNKKSLVIIVVSMPNGIFELVYYDANYRISPPVAAWHKTFPTKHSRVPINEVFWLYEELHHKNNKFRYEILTNDGRVIKITFATITVTKFWK